MWHTQFDPVFVLSRSPLTLKSSFSIRFQFYSGGTIHTYILKLPGAKRVRFNKMFVLAEMKDTVRVKPWHFGVDLREAIATKLNKKLANKVSGCKKSKRA